MGWRADIGPARPGPLAEKSPTIRQGDNIPISKVPNDQKISMAAEVESSSMAAAAATSTNNKKRKLNHGKGKKKKMKPNKKLKPVAKARNPSQKMKKLFKKRAKAYNSDDDEEEDEEEENEDERGFDYDASDGDGEDEEGDSNLNCQRDSGITKFSDGCRAFRTAFLKIMNKHLPIDPLGPILSAHKKLVAEKLLEEETEHKAKGQAKKAKHLAGEKGHVKPDSVLDSKERLLISIATKGVVKLFNAVNKAQNPQKDLNPSKSKDAKELAKRRKQTFLSELKKPAIETQPFNSSMATKSANEHNDDEPGWAPLRDSYMLTSSKLKDWDRMPDPAAVVDHGVVPLESSSDED